jgi:hypothetical protein
LTNSVGGFSNKGRTSLDLGDINFVNSAEATFTGTSTSGLLTVTDGVHTATIALVGNYLSSNFVASSDGAGGTIVVAQKAPSEIQPVQAFISAMAGFGARATASVAVDQVQRGHELTLVTPSRALR